MEASRCYLHITTSTLYVIGLISSKLCMGTHKWKSQFTACLKALFWCTLTFFYLSLLHFFCFLFLPLTCCACVLMWQQLPNKSHFLAISLCIQKFSPYFPIQNYVVLPLRDKDLLSHHLRGVITYLRALKIILIEENWEVYLRNRTVTFPLEQYLMQSGICRRICQSLMEVSRRNVPHMIKPGPWR